MKILYKNKTIERSVIVVNILTTITVIATFVMLFGFDEPLLPKGILQTIQVLAFVAFLMEKMIRFLNAESKLQFLRGNWFEIPLLTLLLIDFFVAGRWFAVGYRREAIFMAIVVYVVLQAISKICLGIVQLAASGQNPTRTLFVLFIALILVGGGLLMLPEAHTTESMSFTDAMFTATSATCVTGLVVVDTGTDFSRLGQFVILILIQLGGLGIVIFGAVLALLLGQALSVKESIAMQDMVNAQTLNKISMMIGFIFVATLVIEGLGAVSLMGMWGELSQSAAIGREHHQRWFYSVFHSVSAFCNAGFSLFDTSLMDYKHSTRVYTVIAPLIILGGLGFGVLYNLSHVAIDRVRRFFKVRVDPHSKFQMGVPQRVSLQSKIVLCTSGILIIAGAVLIMFFERACPDGQCASSLPDALFQSITSRTAGFNSVDIASLSEGSKLVTMVLMFIGGSPGSTAGGVKTVTLALVVMVVYATMRKRHEVEMFKRSVRLAVVGRAMTVMLLFGVILFGVTMVLEFTERDSTWPLMDLGFEAASALGTVGLSTGVTPTLTVAGKWVIIITMLIGRLGPLTLLAGLTFNLKPATYDYPSEPLMVG
ncbi:MAG: TrkH family potassium uptake protein [Planctomycetota bacterium]|jgi:trk system potassium uptake protein TrkH